MVGQRGGDGVGTTTTAVAAGYVCNFVADDGLAFEFAEAEEPVAQRHVP
jgi:hypothetical protein